MPKQILLLLSAVVGIVLISPPASGQLYPIRLDRHEKAGDRYHLVAMTTETTKADASVSGQSRQKSEDVVIVQLTADVTILEVASNNWATRKWFKVLSSNVTRAGSSGPVVPNGTEVIATIQNGQTGYLINNQPVSAELARDLRLVISLHLASVADDELFGTPTPKRIGESWGVGVNAMKKLLKEMNAKGGRQEITGTGTLEKVEGNHAFVRSSINVRDVLLPIAPELTTEAGEIESELSGRFPLRPRDLTVQASGRVYLSRAASGVDRDGKKVKLHVVYESKSRYEIRPL